MNFGVPHICGVIFCICAASACAAQQLSLSSIPATAGHPSEIAISLQNDSGTNLSTLRWELVIPVARLRVDAAGPTAGPAAISAGKNVVCNGTWLKAPSIYVYSCILFGSGTRPVVDGVIATLGVDQKPSSKHAPVKFQMHAEGLTPDYRYISLQKTDATLTLE